MNPSERREMHEITDEVQAKQIIDDCGFYNMDRPHTALDKRRTDNAYFGKVEVRNAA